MRRGLSAIVVLVAALVFATTTEARNVTLGSEFTHPSTSTLVYCGGNPSCGYVQTSIQGVAHIRAPFGGTITRWRLRSSTGPFRLQILHKRDNGSFKALRQSTRKIGTGGPDSFPTHLAIHQGDFIGVRLYASSNLGLATGTGCYKGFVPALDVGDVGFFTPGYGGCGAGRELLVNAKLSHPSHQH